MANNIKPDPSSRLVLEPLQANFDLTAQTRTSIRSLAGSFISNSQTLIYVGTNSGSLLLLSSSSDVSFLRSVSVADSPVEAVIVLGEEIGRVLLLCDGSLFLVDSLLSQPVKRLGPFKGVSAVAKRVRAGDESESTDLAGPFGSGSESSSTSQRILQRLGGGIRANGAVKGKEPVQQQNAAVAGSDYVFAVVVGKRLILAELVFSNSRIGKIDRDGDSLNGYFVILKEMQCIDGVETIVWLNDSMFVGTVNGYSLYSCVTGQSGIVFTLPDVSSRPVLKLLGKEKKVLLVVDNVGITVNAHGQPVGGSLVFRCSPDSIGELGSYLLLVRDGRLDLYHKKSGSCIQTITFSGEGFGQCVVAGEDGGNGKFVAVATPTKVFCYREVPSDEQIKDLLRKKNFKEAISLVEELESEGELSKETLSFVHAEVGFLLLFDLHFEEAVDHFLQSETMQPSELFPFIMRDPNRWTLLVPRNRYWGLHPPPVPLEDVVDDGLTAIQRAIFLKKAGVETTVDDEFLSNPPTRADLLELAIKNFIRYLEISRQKDLTLPVKEGVDTLLMYLYRALNHVDDMEKLASSENSCIVRSCCQEVA